jgi:hypothetical protein
MNCLLYFNMKEAEAAKIYATRLREEGHRVQFRNGDVFRDEPVPETPEEGPPFDCVICSESTPWVANVYRSHFDKPEAKIRGTVEVVKLEAVPLTPVEEVLQEPLTLAEERARSQDKKRKEPGGALDGPPLPIEPVDYTTMPWFKLRSEVSKLTGTPPKTKKEAIEALDKIGVL